jgi:hypothetical protein
MKIELNNIEELEVYIDQIKDNFTNKGTVMIEISTLTEEGKYRNQYFKILNDLSISTGYKKTDIHDILKTEVLIKTTSNPENRSKHTDLDSTTCLNKRGWDEYLKECKTYFFEKLNKIF